jgi:hypothetical protein
MACAFVVVVLAAAGCGDDGGSTGDTGPGGNSDANDTVTYSEDVQPILQAKCSPCHVTDNFGSVNHASEYADTQRDSMVCIGEKVFTCMLMRIQSGMMPQGRGCTGDPVMDADNAMCLTAAEQATVAAWVADGAPE